MFQRKPIEDKSVFPDLHMVPQALGTGEFVRYSSSLYTTTAIEWVSTEQNAAGNPMAVRIPEESTKTFQASKPFTAMGKEYQTLEQLCAKQAAPPYLFLDIYGRFVFYRTERFPCFDIYDSLYENRHYRWFYILGEQEITRVQYTDTEEEIFVTEDVANIEDDSWEELCELDFY